MGGFGAYEVGGRAVRERYDWAVKRFRPSGGKMSYTYLTIGAGSARHEDGASRVSEKAVTRCRPAGSRGRAPWLPPGT